MDVQAQVGDEIVIDNMELGHPPRKGEVLEILGEDDATHYRVRWDDGHESLFFPGNTTHVVRLKGTSR